MIKERLISEKDFTETNYERLKTTLIYIKKKIRWILMAKYIFQS